METHAPDLHRHLLRSLHDGDVFRVLDAITRTREHHDWHDGSKSRGKPPFVLPLDPVKLITGCCPRESDLKRNLDSRTYHLVAAS